MFTIKLDAVKATLLGILAGVVLAYVGAYLTGYTAAMALPSFIANDTSGILIYLWEMAVTQFLGFGLAAFVLVYLTIRLVRLSTWVFLIVVFIVCELSLSLMPSSYFDFYMPHYIVVIACLFLGAFLASRNISNTKALR